MKTTNNCRTNDEKLRKTMNNSEKLRTAAKNYRGLGKHIEELQKIRNTYGNHK